MLHTFPFFDFGHQPGAEDCLRCRGGRADRNCFHPLPLYERQFVGDDQSSDHRRRNCVWNRDLARPVRGGRLSLSCALRIHRCGRSTMSDAAGVEHCSILSNRVLPLCPRRPCRMRARVEIRLDWLDNKRAVLERICSKHHAHLIVVEAISRERAAIDSTGSHGCLQQRRIFKCATTVFTRSRHGRRRLATN
jgi:hypothetical protein